ncbi:hypothetical protein HZ326_30147 [Fusarium oxysporum f. sp. albedinis]|nr:hypothetical protein HZ326_30147 [Fusarium oxysporum f. sp. albedinis]
MPVAGGRAAGCSSFMAVMMRSNLAVKCFILGNSEGQECIALIRVHMCSLLPGIRFGIPYNQFVFDVSTASPCVCWMERQLRKASA